MSGMACSLFDEVEQDPPDRAGLWIGKPVFSRRSYTTTQIVDATDQRIGTGASQFVLIERLWEGLVIGEHKAIHVLLESRGLRRHGFDSVAPVAFSVG